MERKKRGSALHVNEGVDQPASLNSRWLEQSKKRSRRQLSSAEFVSGILSGDRVVLSKAITLVESNRPGDYQMAQEIIEKCLPYSGDSVRVGITGVPGVGKSSFIEALGTFLIKHGHKLAVLAIDPSSQRSKGSILGDKTRMETLAGSNNAFIRPSPSAGSLGGVARKTRETIILCEAAGYHNVLVETVGVGQSETAVYELVDFFLLLMLSGAGDELQGIKRGIMEMSDAIVINKADGDNVDAARQAERQYANALHLFPAKESGWAPKTNTCSAITGNNIPQVWEMIRQFITLTKKNGAFARKRQEQEIHRMYESINERLQNDLHQNQTVKKMQEEMEQRITRQEVSAYVAAQQVFETYKKSREQG